uniref:DNA-directed RNA polymerases I, II, and III subunit RPABC5 n=1 Tax=Rhinolophus ferrumequinum TaxID=59479 RepID=A0A671DLZ6_RHIFE
MAGGRTLRGPAGCHPASVIIPARCFTCGKITGNKWEAYLRLLRTEDSKGDTLDTLGLKRSHSHCLLLAMGTWPRKFVPLGNSPPCF